MSKVTCITPSFEGKKAKCAAAKESMAKLWSNRFLTDNENLKTGLAKSMCAGNEKEMDSIFWRMKDPKDPNYYKRNEFITETYDETLSPPQAHRLAGTAWSTSELETLWKKKGQNSIEELSGKFGKSYHEIFLKLEDMADPTSTSYHAKVLGKGKKDKEKKEKVKRGMPSSVTKAVAPPDQKETFEVSESQMRALKAIASRKSVFYTGAAGTGKSFITGVLKKMLDHLNLTKKMAVTAPTGVAACNVGGMTIHSWAGVGLGDKPVEKLVGAIRGMQKQGGDSAFRRWRETEILVIDEISMLGADLFEKVSQVGMHIRNDFTMPFGGIQLILCGDFFQLPPVSKGKGTGNLFAFSTETWRTLLPDKEQSVVLDKVFRQKDGPLLRILNSMRRGVVTQEAKEVLNRKVSEYQQEIAVQQQVKMRGSGESEGQAHDKTSNAPKVRHTILFPKNVSVDEINKSELKKLYGINKEDGSPDPEANGVEYVAIDTGRNQHVLKDLKAPPILELRRGAQVMLVKNIDQKAGLVNGTRGIVTEFEYVEGELLPICTFNVSMDGELVQIEGQVIKREEFDIMRGEETIASRTQLPLQLAWALTVHKSQGLTIKELDLTFAGMFEYGQGYVALSRAVDLEGLRLRAFDDACVKAHPSVVDFYRQIGYGEDAVEQLTGDKELIKTDIVKLSQMFKLTIPRATDYKNDQVWIQGGNGHNNSDQQQKSERGFHTGNGAATNDFQRFDNDFTDATRGWQSQHKRVGPYANFESMMQSSLPSEEFTNRRLENAATAAQAQRNPQGHGRSGASSSTSTSTSSGGSYNQGGGGGTYSQYNNNNYNSSARVPFKDESSTELEPGYADCLKAQKQNFLSRPGRSLPPAFASGVTSFVAPVPVPVPAAAASAAAAVVAVAAPTDADAAPKRQLTEEQKARIEANKQKALQKKLMLQGAAAAGGGHEPVVDLTGGGAFIYRGL